MRFWVCCCGCIASPKASAEDASAERQTKKKSGGKEREREREREREDGRRVSKKSAPHKREERRIRPFCNGGGSACPSTIKKSGNFPPPGGKGERRLAAQTQKGQKTRRRRGERERPSFFPFLNRRPDFVKTKRGKGGEKSEIDGAEDGGGGGERIASGARQEEGRGTDPPVDGRREACK